ncbi:hypothetical protein ACG94S_19015, partial [Acinetobacter beijerinckii]
PSGSWRHTPLRNFTYPPIVAEHCSWRHTPLRKKKPKARDRRIRSWRHTPLRKNSTRIESGDICRYYVATAQRYNNQLLTFRKSRD